jgi:AsmA-like C-terminal region/AsmA family
LFVFIGGLLVLLLLGALIAPYFVDWAGYRSDFERVASQVLGRKVTVEGGASARILPFPSVTFENVKVGDDAENPAMTIAKFSMDAELAPFLKGEVLVFDMRVEKPRMFVSVAPDGTVDWVLRPQSPKGIETISLEHVTISDGAVEINNQAADRLDTIEALNATVAAKSLSGPWRFEGSLNFDDEALYLTGSSAKAEDDGALPLRISINPTKRSMLAELSGRVKLDGNSPVYTGEFLLRPALLTDPGAVALRDGEGGTTGAPSDDPVFNIKGKFEARHDGLTMPSYRLESGPKTDPYFAEGSGKIAWGTEPRFEIVADGAQVTFKETAGGAGANFSDRIAAVGAFLSKIPVPAMPGEVKVDLPAVVAGDTTIREVSLLASPLGNAWNVKSLTAALPGRTKIEAIGKLETGGKFGFAGNLLVASNQPSGLSAWLSGSVPGAVRALPAIGFDAKVTLTKDVQIFENLELLLGNTSLRGHVERRSNGARPSVAASFSADELDLAQMHALGSVVIGPDASNNFAGQDLSIALKAGPVSALDVTADTLDLALRIKDDRLDIDRLLISGLAEASISGTAKLFGFPANVNGTADASILSADGTQLLALIGEKFPQAAFFKTLAERALLYPDLYADTKIDLFGSLSKESGASETSVSYSASMGKGVYSGTATLKGGFADIASAQIKANLEGKHEDALALLTLAGVPTLPVGSPGGGSFQAAVEGVLKNALSVKTKLSTDSVTGEINGNFSKPGGVWSGSGDVVLKAADIEPYLMASGIVLPSMGQGTDVNAKAGMTLGGQSVTFNNLDGTIAGTDVGGNIKFDFAQSPAKIGGDLRLDQLSVDWLGEALLGAGSLTASDASWPDAAFASESLITLQGSVNLQAATADIGSYGTISGLNGALALSSNALSLRNLSGDFQGGQISGTIDAKNDNGTGLFSSDIKLVGARFEKLVPQENVKGALDFAGSLSAASKTAAGLVAALTGSGTAKLRDTQISGLNPKAFNEIFETASRDQKAPDAAGIETRLRQKISAGALQAGTMDFSWTAASGTLRFPPLTINFPEGQLSAQTLANLDEGTARVDGQFAFDPGSNAIAGVDPVVPFSITYAAGAYQSTFDAQPVAQYFTQRALEIEQALAEAKQAELLEAQRLRREVRYYAYLAAKRAEAELTRLVNAEDVRVRAASIRWQALLGEERARQEAERKAAEEKARLEEEAAAREAAAAAATQKPLPAPDPVLEIDPQSFESGQTGTILDGLDVKLPPVQ